jgi:hypothetical protein
LERQIYGWNEEGDSDVIEFLIHAVQKLGAAVIRDVRGVGWMVDRPLCQSPCALKSLTAGPRQACKIVVV